MKPKRMIERTTRTDVSYSEYIPCIVIISEVARVELFTDCHPTTGNTYAKISSIGNPYARNGILWIVLQNIHRSDIIARISSLLKIFFV